MKISTTYGYVKGRIEKKKKKKKKKKKSTAAMNLAKNEVCVG